jgi:phosphatidylinositol alpha-1,6-mannosyltransferase
MRHLFVTVDYPPDLGGMARRHVELCRRLAPDEAAVSTVAAAGAAAFDRGEPYPIERQRFDASGARLLPNLVQWGAQLARRCRAEVDVLHSANLRPSGYPVLWAARRTGTPFIVYVNGGDVLHEQRKARRSRFTRGMSRRMLGEAAAVLATSAWTAERVRELAAELRLPRAPRIETIELGTDPAQFDPSNDTGALRRRLGLADRPLMLTVARLVPHKGHDVALHVLHALRARIPGLHYLVVGTGPHEPQLRALAASLGLADAVTFAGALGDADVAEAYATADVYVGLSREEGGNAVEGFGIALVEAAASGTPCVAGRAGGIPSAVRDGETGVLVPPTDADAAAAAVARILDDAAWREHLSRGARRAVESHYNWDRVAAETRALAHDVVARHAAARLVARRAG